MKKELRIVSASHIPNFHQVQMELDRHKHQKAVDTIKNIILRKTLLSYPYFTKKIDVHTNSSDLQLGAVIIQNKKPIAFYSRTLNPAQTWYTTTESEILVVTYGRSAPSHEGHHGPHGSKELSWQEKTHNLAHQPWSWAKQRSVQGRYGVQYPHCEA